MSKKEPRQCKHCNSVLPPESHRSSTFCSNECRKESRRIYAREWARESRKDPKVRARNVENSKRYAETNREKVLAAGRRHYWENREQINAKSRRYHEDNREYRLEYFRSRREDPEFQENQRLYMKKWREENPEWDSEYRDGNRDSIWDRACKRRSNAYGVRYEYVSRSSVLDRDNWECVYCHESLDDDTKWPDQKSIAMDHVIPISKGGEHTEENVVSCCHNCNVVKGDRILQSHPIMNDETSKENT